MDQDHEQILQSQNVLSKARLIDALYDIVLNKKIFYFTLGKNIIIMIICILSLVVYWEDTGCDRLKTVICLIILSTLISTILLVYKYKYMIRSTKIDIECCECSLIPYSIKLCFEVIVVASCISSGCFATSVCKSTYQIFNIFMVFISIYSILNFIWAYLLYILFRVSTKFRLWLLSFFLAGQLKIIKYIENKGDICPMCTENYKINDELVILPCDHGFHTNCITTLIINKNACPLCVNLDTYTTIV